MRLTQPPPPRRDQETALIPLINIVFLLLIFFMIVGTIAPTDALPIDPPTSRQGRAAEPDPLQLLIDAEGRIAINGEVVPADRVAAVLAEQLRSTVASAQKGTATTGAASGTAPGDEPAQAAAIADASAPRELASTLTVKADAAVAMADLRALLRQLRALGVDRVRLLTRQD